MSFHSKVELLELWEEGGGFGENAGRNTWGGRLIGTKQEKKKVEEQRNG